MDDTIADYYALLSIPRSASPVTIRQAYRRLVLQYHPDKRTSRLSTSPLPSVSIDVAQLTAAYATLSSPSARKDYDSALKSYESTHGAGAAGGRKEQGSRRPAELVSLDEFSPARGGLGDDMVIWTYPCRCGDVYKIAETDLEKDLHLLECGGCSEVVWVDYEEVEDAHDAVEGESPVEHVAEVQTAR